MTGPTPEFMIRYSRATQAPIVMALGLDGVTALNERVIAAGTYEALDDDDKRLILRAEQQIRAGESPTLQNPADWDWDWMAEDAALDDPLLADDDASGEDDEAKGIDYDDEGWIGL